MDRLLEYTSLGALHNSAERHEPPSCHPQTRTAVLQYLMKWLIGHVGWDIFILWLYGPAGAGKSAIAQTLAERCSKTNTLLASFFFCRSDPKRNNDKALVATLVYQMALHIPGFWDVVEVAIESNPAIFQLNFDAQFRTLLLDPFLRIASTCISGSGTAVPYVFIIDGLDECNGSDSQRNILNTISHALQRHRSTLPFKFLIATRPDHHLSTSFQNPSLNHLTYRMVLDDTYQPDKDIKLYLMDSLLNIRKTHVTRVHLPKTWPTEEDVNKIVKKSSGHFIYPATVLRYLSSPRHNPVDRLKVIQGILPVNNDKPYAQIDALYISILSEVEHIEETLRVLGVHLLVRSAMSVNRLEMFMLLAPGTIRLLLIDLTSVVSVPYTNWESLQILHASFSDFLFDPTRSLQFHINPRRIHEAVVHYCVAQINLFCLPTASEPKPEIYFLVLAFREFSHHLRSSGPLFDDPALREEVRSLPFLHFFKELHWKHAMVSRRTPGEVITNFLHALKSAHLWHAEDDLYLHHRATWDQEMLENLSLVPKSPGLAFWICICLSPPDSLRYGVYRDTLLALPPYTSSSDMLLYMPFALFTGHIFLPPILCGNALRRWSLGISWPTMHPDYFTLVSEFLSDPLRAGLYTVDESTYTQAAEFIVAFAIKQWDDKKARISTGDDTRQWDLIWDALISALSRAAYSNELMRMLNHQKIVFTLGCPSYFWKAEESLRSMFRVVSDYLSVFTGTIPTGFEIVIDWTGNNQSYTYYIGSDRMDTNVVFTMNASTFNW